MKVPSTGHAIERRASLARTARVLLRRWATSPVIASGSVVVEGLEADVLVHRDRYGIVHIEALTEADGWFASGFCQGQDRPRRAPAAVSGLNDRFSTGVRAGATSGRRRAPLPLGLLTGDLPAHELQPPWYLVHLRTPTLHLAGAQELGSAHAVAGHDERTSWPPDPEKLHDLRFQLSADPGRERWAGLRVAYPGGQSDDPDSAHLDDLSTFWRSGHGVPIAWTRDDVAVATTATLRLSAQVPPGHRGRATWYNAHDTSR